MPLAQHTHTCMNNISIDLRCECLTLPGANDRSPSQCHKAEMLLAQIIKIIIKAIIKVSVDDAITKNLLILRNEKSVMTVIRTIIDYNNFWMTCSRTLYSENLRNSVNASIIPHQFWLVDVKGISPACFSM